MAAAAAAVFGMWGTSASALSLGRIAVLSALGEPLRAEIDMPDINAEEASSLKATVALPEAFRRAGVQYNPLMNALQISLQKKPDGRAYLRINSDRPVNDPFVDLILEASWSSGRIVRDYTMLFDPPNLKQAQAVTPTLPQVSSAPVSVSPAQPAPAVAARAARSAPATRTTPAADAAKTPAVSADKRVTIKSGDTASKIALASKPAGVSLDQMLVALLRANPEAFIDNNINRIKAGAVLTLPGAEQAQAMSEQEATQIVVAQSKDFNEFRRKLAGSAPISQVAAADRRASGSVQAQVEEKKPAMAAPDKLTLSKGAVQGKTTEDKIAKERTAQDASKRAEELSKNIAELGKLGSAAAPSAPAAAPASAEPAVAPAPPATPAVVAAPAETAMPPQGAASAPVAAASAPAKRPAVAVAPTPMAEPSLMDELLDNPLIPAAAGGLVALLAGLGFYRIRQRKQAAQIDSSYLESRLQPDSFFGASGGQRVDTNDGGATGSSMVYSPSQLDAADDVDPVAEADVYLAYGRDLQAEEILKEALRTHPGRVAIHQKLLEIYAKRRDVRNFEHIANEAFKLTGGEGLDWDRVCELGMSIDPSNALYQPGGHPASSPAPLESTATAAAGAFASSTVPQTLQPTLPTVGTGSDLDLDLDFSLDDEPVSAISEAGYNAAATASTPAEPPALDLSFDLPTEESPAVAAADNSLEFDVPELPELAAATDDLSFTAEEEPGRDTTPAPLKSPGASSADTGSLEFDLGSLSLDLGTPSEQPAATSDDPLATKLALAEEFSAIGDSDGARALIEEIIAEASGEMKAKAQKALSELG